MKIAIDASRANKQQKTGVEWYSYYIIEEFKKVMPQKHQVILYTNEKLKGRLGECPQGWREEVLNWPVKYLWTQVRLWWELIINPPDVLFVPAHTIPLLPILKKVKVMVNVHDVGFKRFPELYKKIQVWYHELTMRHIKLRADKIITISEFSKKEIMELYGVSEEKIEVVYLGVEQKAGSGKFSRFFFKNREIPLPYLLFVGRIEKKKNIVNMVKAFVAVKNQYPDLKLILAGIKGNAQEEVENLIKAEGLENRIILPGYISDNDFNFLMANAEIFLFPTLYEGFGLPILQAMVAGVPVITSRQDPHQEVGGEAVLYADPSQPEDIAGQIEKILNNSELRQKLIKKGQERIKQFSWQKTAEKILKILVA